MERAQRRALEDAGVATRERAESIGAYLARQRVLRGITLEELAESTRIPLRSLARLEAGVFDDDPDGFVRGFVRTVATALGLPPDETVARMLPEASDEERQRGLLRLWLNRGLVAVAILLSLFVAVWTVTGRQLLPGSWTQDRDELVMRRDAIRALADEQGAKEAPPRSAVSTPGPAPRSSSAPRRRGPQ